MIWLTRITGLAIYDRWGMTPAVEKNLGTVAILLCVLCFIDIFAWTGFWNTILTGGPMVWRPISAAAIIAGCAMAVGILAYESAFITTNFRERRRPFVGVAIRSVSILVIAFLTSLPLDLYLLDQNINQRIHEEQVLKQVPPLVQKWLAAQENANGTSTRSQAETDKALVGPQGDLQSAEVAKVTAAQAVEDARHRVDTNRRDLNALIGRMGDRSMSAADTVRLRDSITAARNALNRSQQRLDAENKRLESAEAARSKADMNVKQIRANVRVDLATTASADEERYVNWIHDLWAAKALQTVRERAVGKSVPAGELLAYDGAAAESNFGVGERLIVLNDILQGRPPRRPKMSESDLQTAEKMKLGPFVSSVDTESVDREKQEASSLRTLSWSLFGFFTLLPGLVMANKALFEKDTEDYLDVEHQRAIGNPNVGPRKGPGEPG